MVFDAGLGKCRPLVETAPTLSSASTLWSGILLEQHSVTDFEAEEICPLKHTISLQLNSPITVERKLNGKFRELTLLPGQFNIFPAWTFHTARAKGVAHFLSISFEPAYLHCIAPEIQGLDRLEFISEWALNDRLVEGICIALKSEIEAGALGGKLYGESLFAALAIHLIRKYSVKTPRFSEAQGRLSKTQLRRAIEFFHEHAGKPISLRETANAVGLSPYHFVRMFKNSTGCTPHQYLIRCRVEKARHLLLCSRMNLAQIALQVGFCDQSHLTAHFRRVLGVTPGEYARRL